MSHRRIKFYSVHDMSIGWYLKEVEQFFENWEDKVDNADINTILELYNIKQFFDADMRLEKWTEPQLQDYREKCSQIPGIIGRYFSTISDANFIAVYKAIEWNYVDDFWTVLCDYKSYKRISQETFGGLLENNESIVWHVLKRRVLVEKFGSVIAGHLEQNSQTAEKLISNYLAAHEHDATLLVFPAEFSQSMRDKVLSGYVEQEEGNINSLRLLEEAQSTKEFPISDRLRLKARRKCELLQEKLFSGSAGMKYGAQISFASIPEGSMEDSYEDNILSSTYSREWLTENQDYPTLLNNFIYLFGYVDRFFRCTFVSQKCELGVFERHLGVKGRKDYEKGIAFNVKHIRSLLQMLAYQEELQRLDIKVENLFKWFFEEYLRDEFGANGFTYSPPSDGTTYAEKCKLLAIAIDGALKQYRLFCEDGYVDRELLEMSSGHVVFSELVSMRRRKYVYSQSAEIRTEQYLLYSDQSTMTYTEKTGSKYQTLPQLLMLEEMKKEDFERYQQKDLDWLIERGAITVSSDGTLAINRVRAYVLKELFSHEVISPAYFGPKLQAQINEMVATGDLSYGDTLFSKPEQDYMNYVLNKSEFSNGLDLRNKYSHDTCSLEEKIQQQDYMELLKIMVLIIIKINEEFCKQEELQ